MKKLFMILLMLLALAAAAFGYYIVHCPIDDYASCYFTGQTTSENGHWLQLYHCSCGHNVWVKAY